MYQCLFDSFILGEQNLHPSYMFCQPLSAHKLLNIKMSTNCWIISFNNSVNHRLYLTLLVQLLLSSPFVKYSIKWESFSLVPMLIIDSESLKYNTELSLKMGQVGVFGLLKGDEVIFNWKVSFGHTLLCLTFINICNNIYIMSNQNNS